MPAEAQKVCVVILNLGGLPVMEDCLRSLAAADYPGLEVILVHNGPRAEGLEAEARAACPKISGVIFTGANLGFAAGNNPGIKAALARGADYVLLLNDDTVVAPDFLGPLVGALRNEPGAGMAGPRIFYHSDPDRIWFSGARFSRADCSFVFPGANLLASEYGHGEPGPADYITGCAALVSRELIERVGLLDERFFLYWEDSDWGLRAARAGFKSLVVPASKIWHKVSYSSGGDESALKAYHKTRAQLLFAGIHAPSARGRLITGFSRDLLWLLLKSGKPGRFKRFAALLAGVIHYFAGRTGSGPRWLV